MVCLFVCLSLLAGCTQPAAPPSALDLLARKAPPPPTAGCPHLPLHEGPTALPKPPVSAFPQVAQPAHWDWDGRGYVWVPARWVIKVTDRKPLWTSGAWRRSGAACVWQKAHWVVPPV